MELIVLQKLQEALDSRDALRAASFYSADALFVTSGRLPAEGREAIQRTFNEDFRAPGFSLVLAIERVEVAASGDMAVVRGTFRMSFSPPGESMAVVGGSYLQVLRRRAGQWRVAIDISTPTPTR